VVGRYANVAALNPNKLTLVVITGSALLSWSLMLSAGAGVGDARLLRPRRSRPHPVLAGRRPPALLRAHRGHGVLDHRHGHAAGWRLHRRPGVRGGLRWLGAYGVVVAMGVTATARWRLPSPIALFHLIGPRRTRLVAQIVSAVIGAIFVIGLQAGAILSYGTLSRIAFLESDTVLALVPAIDSSSGGRPAPISATPPR